MSASVVDQFETVSRTCLCMMLSERDTWHVADGDPFLDRTGLDPIPKKSISLAIATDGKPWKKCGYAIDVTYDRPVTSARKTIVANHGCSRFWSMDGYLAR